MTESAAHTDPLPVPDTLPGVFDQVWEQLARAARDRRHGFHTPVLATVGPTGSPNARTVVLRDVDREAGVLQCHTDARSPKAEQITDTARVCWCFYDVGKRLQVRAGGSARIERPGSSALADDAWDRSSVGARKCYLAPEAPTTASKNPSPNLPAHAIGATLSEPDVAQGRENFAVLRTTLDTIDWLVIRHNGHRRALFRRSGDGWSHTWLQP